RDVECWPDLIGELSGYLEQQGGLPDAWIATDQHQAAWHHSAAQHARELLAQHRQTRKAAGWNVAQGYWLVQAVRRCAPLRRILLTLYLLDQAVPGAAVGALPHPACLL